MGKQKNPLKPLEYQPFNPHKAFEMLRKDTDTIVIFIHGFLGSPHQFISLADFLLILLNMVCASLTFFPLIKSIVILVLIGETRSDLAIAFASIFSLLVII